MTQPAIDQNTLLAEARQALEKLDRMKAERSRLDLEEKQLRRQLETEKKAAEDSVALTVKKTEAGEGQEPGNAGPDCGRNGSPSRP